MGLFDGIQDLISSASDAVQGSVEDVAGGIADNQVVQDLQDQASNVTDGASTAATDAAEQVQGSVEDISSKFGL